MIKRIRLILGISLLWLPLSMLFDGLNTLILPAYLVDHTPEATRATLLGLITFSGLGVGMAIQPIAGTYSDRLYSRWGRRGMITLGVVPLLPLLLLLGFQSNFLGLLVVYWLIQVAVNIAQAAQQGFIPDLVPSTERGVASGIKNLLDIGGALLVFMLLAQLFSEGKADQILPLIAVIFLVALVLTLLLVREPIQKSPSPLPRVTLATAFRLDLATHRAFAWLIMARFLFLLGTYTVGRFLLFFATARLNLDANAAGVQTARILTILTLITVVCAPIAGWLADRMSRLQLMILGGAFSTLGVLLLMIATTADQILMFGALMAMGSAAFAAANWALSADLAPPGENARFLALANFGTAGAAAVAGLFGLLIDVGNQLGTGTGYTVLFITAAATFIASGIAVRHIEVRQPLAHPAGQAADHSIR
jgi:MFS family permease